MNFSRLHLTLSVLMFVGALHLMPRTQVVPCPEGETCEDQPAPEDGGNQSPSE